MAEEKKNPAEELTELGMEEIEIYTLTDEDGNIYDIIAGTFLLVGLCEDDFASLSPELSAKFAKRFARPEAFVRMDGRIAVIRM